MRSIQNYRPATRRTAHQNGYTARGLFQPLANILETEDGYTVELATPGYRREDLTIKLQRGALVIEGKREEETTEKYARQEFGIGNFTKRFRLGENVDRDAITADYEDGVLIIALPNRPEEKKRDITIS